MRVYYNENEPYCAEWLRNLVRAGEIPAGDVDDRDVREVRPDDLRGYDQCHFFAGIGLWARALRDAGWPDDREIWIGSCPCQPFSPAGRGAGFADERHLWPAWERLVRERRPRRVAGEQVDGPAGRLWLDLVLSDLEASGYAGGAIVFPAAGVGAPHRRHRVWWGARLLADAESGQQRRDDRAGVSSSIEPSRCGSTGRVADADGGQRGRVTGGAGRLGDGRPAGRDEGDGEPLGGGAPGDVGQSDGGGRPAGWSPGPAVGHGEPLVAAGGDGPLATVERGTLRLEGSSFGEAEPLRGFWSGADWVWCSDGKYRAVESRAFPLADGYPGRVQQLRAYGNAICLPAAIAFVRAFAGATADRDALA